MQTLSKLLRENITHLNLFQFRESLTEVYKVLKHNQAARESHHYGGHNLDNV